MITETREPRIKMYDVLMRVVGDQDVVVAESVYGVHAVRRPAPCAPYRKPKNSSAGPRKPTGP
jgi:hypothetical protein